MQTSPFDAAGYPAHPLQHSQTPGMYGTMSGFDPTAGLKFNHHHHHSASGGYADAAQAEAAVFYQNYGVPCSQDYVGGLRGEPPSYADSTVTSSASSSTSLFHHHPGFMPADYYKTGGMGGIGGLAGINRQMEMMNEYGVRTPGHPSMADNFLMKPEGNGGGSSGGGDAVVTAGANGQLMDYNGRYTTDDLHHLQHHHTHQQQQQQHHHLHHHQQQQHQQPNSNNSLGTGELTPVDECKLEPDAQQEFKPTVTELGIASANHMTNLHHQHQQQQPHHHQRHDDHSHHSDLQQEGEQHHHHSQSPCSEDGSGEGDNSACRTDGEANTSGRGEEEEASPQPQQQDTTTTTPTTTNTTTTTTTSDDKTSSNEVKPTLSYIALIAKSILESPARRLNLGSIYGWIEKNFPYYKNRGQGWRNSVRHNLSLNDCFIKAGRCEDGKGNYWAIHPANMQDFLRGDFRQRRRSRRRGRKKDCELNMYHHHHTTNPYLNAAAADVAAARAQMTFTPSLPNLYPSPYTDAERRAYRLDEALLRQSMNNPLFKWYHQTSVYPPATSPSAAAAAAAVNTYGGSAAVGGSGAGTPQWAQSAGYGTENNGQGVYSPLNSTFSRNYSTPAIV